MFRLLESYFIPLPLGQMCDSYGRFNSVYQTHLYASVLLLGGTRRPGQPCMSVLLYARHLVYDGARSDVTHTAFVLCVVGMEKRHLTRDRGCEGWLIPMVSIDPQVEERQCFRVMHMLR